MFLVDDRNEKGDDDSSSKEVLVVWFWLLFIFISVIMLLFLKCFLLKKFWYYNPWFIFNLYFLLRILWLMPMFILRLRIGGVRGYAPLSVFWNLVLCWINFNEFWRIIVEWSFIFSIAYFVEVCWIDNRIFFEACYYFHFFSFDYLTNSFGSQRAWSFVCQHLSLRVAIGQTLVGLNVVIMVVCSFYRG